MFRPQNLCRCGAGQHRVGDQDHHQRYKALSEVPARPLRVKSFHLPPFALASAELARPPGASRRASNTSAYISLISKFNSDSSFRLWHEHVSGMSMNDDITFLHLADALSVCVFPGKQTYIFTRENSFKLFTLTGYIPDV